jgi:hypothetical protein
MLWMFAGASTFSLLAILDLGYYINGISNGRVASLLWIWSCVGALGIALFLSLLVYSMMSSHLNATQRAIGTTLSLAIVALWLGLWPGRNPIGVFQAGWRKWLLRNVDIPAIRRWGDAELNARVAPSTLPVIGDWSSRSIIIPPPEWPPEICEASPIEVRLIFGRAEGILVFWRGNLSTAKRVLFVNRNVLGDLSPTSLPEHVHWEALEKGAYFGVLSSP